MEQLSIIIISFLFSIIIAMLGYYLKITNKEYKDMLKELTELKHLLVSIKTQIEKSIVLDIEEVKDNIKRLFDRTHNNRAEIGKLNEKVKSKVGNE